eukprot:GHVS01074750.1.p1 GENE.GHVS01074750.1~~GHVS01074750.1.p1  ORF type:complete len:321 (+),score=23.11 GHVS01074750.1:107-1069(+)
MQLMEIRRITRTTPFHQTVLVVCMVCAFVRVVSGEVHVWTSTNGVPLKGASVGEWSTRVENLRGGARLRHRFGRGLSANADFVLNETAGSLLTCEGVGVSMETDVLKSGRLRGDVSLRVPSKAVKFVYSGRFPSTRMQIDYDTEEHLGKFEIAGQKKMFGGRNIVVSPAHDFRTGESSLQLDADITGTSNRATQIRDGIQRKIPFAINAVTLPGLTAGLTLRRDKHGQVDADFRLRHHLNDGRDTFTPSWNMRDRAFTYQWLHRFGDGCSRVKTVLDGKRRLLVEWVDAAPTGGNWVSQAEIPLNDPLQGVIKIKREFSF